MATPPTRIAAAVPSTGNYTTTTSPKVTTALNCLVGDVVIVAASSEQAGTNANVTPTASAGTFTWSLVSSSMVGTTNQSGAKIWAGTCTAAGNATFSLARINTGTTLWWGMSATQWRGVTAVNALWTTAPTSGTASSIAQSTTTLSLQANSACQIAFSDWNAVNVTTRTYQTINGAQMTESLYVNGASHATAYGAFRTDVGAAGTEVVGLTTPATLRWVMVGAELVGAADSTTTGTVSASVPRVTSTLAGSVTVPSTSGTLGASVPRATASLAGTTTVPSATGTVSASTPVMTASVAGTATVPSYSGTLSASASLAIGSIAGTFTAAPGYTGTVSASTPPLTSSGAGTVSVPVYPGAAAASVPPVTGSMSGAVSAPTYAGTLSAPIAPTRAMIAGTVTNPAGAATLSASVPRTTSALAGTVTAPVWTATLAAQLARITSATVGTVTAPIHTGTITSTAPGVTGSIAGVAQGGGPLPPTPPERTLSVQGESRTIAAKAEVRSLGITAESRTLRVPAENRTLEA